MSSAIISQARSEGRTGLTVNESKDVLREFGLPVNETVLVRDEAEVGPVAERLGFPVVMKIVSPQILHKTDVGGVVLDIRSAEQAREEYNAMLARVRQVRPEADITGVALEHQLGEGLELIVGTLDDPVFGPCLMFGMGGILVEVLKDVSFRLIPAERSEVEAMVGEINFAKLLDGVRGQPPVDKAAVVDVLMKVSEFVSQHSDSVAEIDLNPIIASPTGVEIPDARIILKS